MSIHKHGGFTSDRVYTAAAAMKSCCDVGRGHLRIYLCLDILLATPVAVTNTTSLSSFPNRPGSAKTFLFCSTRVQSAWYHSTVCMPPETWLSLQSNLAKTATLCLECTLRVLWLLHNCIYMASLSLYGALSQPLLYSTGSRRNKVAAVSINASFRNAAARYTPRNNLQGSDSKSLQYTAVAMVALGWLDCPARQRWCIQQELLAARAVSYSLTPGA